MFIRECPKCCSAWYRAKQSTTWVCPKCGFKIPASKNFKETVDEPAVDISTMTKVPKNIH
ncbi:MAG: hypothetical protein ACOY46_18055 [Bacillota bacterium]